MAKAGGTSVELASLPRGAVFEGTGSRSRGHDAVARSLNSPSRAARARRRQRGRQRDSLRQFGPTRRQALHPHARGRDSGVAAGRLQDNASHQSAGAVRASQFVVVCRFETFLGRAWQWEFREPSLRTAPQHNVSTKRLRNDRVTWSLVLLRWQTLSWDGGLPARFACTSQPVSRAHASLAKGARASTRCACAYRGGVLNRAAVGVEETVCMWHGLVPCRLCTHVQSSVSAAGPQNAPCLSLHWHPPSPLRALGSAAVHPSRSRV